MRRTRRISASDKAAIDSRGQTLSDLSGDKKKRASFGALIVAAVSSRIGRPIAEHSVTNEESYFPDLS